VESSLPPEHVFPVTQPRFGNIHFGMFENKKLALFRTKLTDKIDFLEREKK
jgi:hypothetical protein